MSQVVKICKIHGELSEELICLRNNGKGVARTCILCNREKSRKEYRKNIEKYKARKRKDYLENRDKYIAYSKKYKQDNPEIVKNTRRIYGINHKDRMKDRTLREKFNITLIQYNEMLAAQNNVCAICFQPEKSKAKNSDYLKNLSVDHCHTTGKIRALLCDICNRGLGYFNESIESLQEAIKYLLKHKT